MANKETLDTLIAQIRQLLKYSEEIYENEIYPVSFFSNAFDSAGRINELLKEIEESQIALFEKQIKAHQAQILSAAPILSAPKAAPQPVDVAPTPPPTETPIPPTPKPEPTPTATPIPPPAEPPAPVKTQTDADLKKRLTLNDRFRFKRELFNDDETLMYQTISELNRLNDYNKGVSFLTSRFNWNADENEAVGEWLAIMEKCYNT